LVALVYKNRLYLGKYLIYCTVSIVVNLIFIEKLPKPKSGRGQRDATRMIFIKEPKTKTRDSGLTLVIDYCWSRLYIKTVSIWVNI
jgi:hypothetical protein